ncbi:MAG: hypothetical protein N3G19_00920 [Candidatus Pacearchaeota archaeon]|nr:hypothetical protein [Candidatus Pacearchaeota archaeon]
MEDNINRELEKEERHMNKTLMSGINGAIIGFIIAVLLLIFPILSFGLAGLSNLLYLSLICVPLGFCMGFIYSYIPNKGLALLLIFIIIILVAFWFFSSGFFERGIFSQFGASVKSFFSKMPFGDLSQLSLYKYCFVADQRCPFFISWERQEPQSKQEEFEINVEFSDNKILQDEANLAVFISVSNPELRELRIKPKCYLGDDKKTELHVTDMGSYAYGDEFVFGKTSSGQKWHTSFRCVGDVPAAVGKQTYSENVVVVLERSVSVKTIWPVRIRRGEGQSLGLIKSVMEFNAPYSIIFSSNNDMPFLEGKEYDFSIVMKRSQRVKFKELNYIKIKFPESLMIDCKNFIGLDHELELRNYSYDLLKNTTQYSEAEDKFSWPCKLYVSEAPAQTILAPATLESKYVVYSESTVRITKS